MNKKLLFVILLILFISCKDDDDNPVSPETFQTFFSLHFDKGMSNGIANVDVEFMTNDLSEIPAVMINEHQMGNFEVREGCIQSRLTNIAYSDSYTYSISANGKTTSGTEQTWCTEWQRKLDRQRRQPLALWWCRICRFKIFRYPQ